MPPKRKGSRKQDNKKTAKQPKQEGQKAVSHDIDVPIDEGFNEDGQLWPKSSADHGTKSQMQVTHQFS